MVSQITSEETMAVSGVKLSELSPQVLPLRLTNPSMDELVDELLVEARRELLGRLNSCHASHRVAEFQKSDADQAGVVFKPAPGSAQDNAEHPRGCQETQLCYIPHFAKCDIC